MKTKIIDAHAHIFPQKIVDKAVKSIGDFYNIPMCRKGTVEDLIKTEGASGIDYFIVSSTATTPHQVASINSFILQSVNENDNLFGLISLHPDLSDEEIDTNIKFALENGLKGIKLHPDFQKFNIDDKKAYRIYERAEGVLPILFHTGDSRYDYSKPSKLVTVAKNFKNLTCIGAHFGGYSRWEEVKCYLETPNVYFDTCSTLFKLEKDKALELIDVFGEDRFMFGVDYPMWNSDEEIKRFNALGISEKTTKKIFFDNSDRIYNLKIKR